LTVLCNFPKKNSDFRNESIRSVHASSPLILLHKLTPQVRVDVAKYYRKHLVELKKNIADRLSRGEQFSLTMDEWTGLGGKKYVNVNLKTIDEKILSLGNS
jgi:hypothetical protein